MPTIQELKKIILLSVRKEREVAYAKDLAGVLDLPIAIYPGSTHLPTLTTECQTFVEIQKQRLQVAIPGIEIIDSILNQPEGILVSNSVALKESNAPSKKIFFVLAPHDETKFDEHNYKKILLPFGRLDTTLKALPIATAIAQKTSSTLVFFHTTRPKQGLKPETWHEHMVPNARETENFLREFCEKQNIPYEMHITSVFPRVIAEGIAQSALDNDCNLIVMSIADDVVFGSHTVQVLNYSPTQL